MKRLWTVGMIWVGVLLLGLPFASTKLLGEVPGEDKIVALLICSAAILWMLLVGVFLGKPNERALVLLGGLFLAIAPLVHWYWTATEFRRAVSVAVDYESILRESRVYSTDLGVTREQWERHTRQLQNRLKLADARMANAPRFQGISWPHLLLSLTGLCLTVPMAFEMVRVHEQYYNRPDLWEQYVNPGWFVPPKMRP